MDATSASRLWGPLEEVAKLHATNSEYVDGLQREVEAEEREPGEAPPKRHRGKGQSPAEELLLATLDFWATTLQQSRKEVEYEGDLEPPEEAELSSFVRATISEFGAGSLTMRVGVVRLWKNLFAHLAEERIAMCPRLDADVCAAVVAAVQEASLDQRSERLRRPALEFAAALTKDTEPGGGRQALKSGLAAAAAAEAGSAAPRTVPLCPWLAKLDPATVEQCAEQVAALRALETAQ